MTTEAGASEPEFRTVPLDFRMRAPAGFWARAVIAAREATLQSRAIEIDDPDGRQTTRARANLYTGRYLNPGEHVHLSRQAGVLRMWLTFDEQSGAQP